MTLRPEQVKAKEYLDQQGSRRSGAQIRDRVAASFRALEEFLDGVSEEDARARPMAGEWTIQEIADHLVETHRPSVVELRELLANRRPEGGPIPAALQSVHPMMRAWTDLLNDLKSVQAEAVETLAAAPDTPTDARAPVVMVINVKEGDGRETPLHWVEELDWKAYAIVFRLHVLDHLGQARKILAAGRR
jgi:DinB family protein